jgi:hypothetical protein
LLRELLSLHLLEPAISWAIGFAGSDRLELRRERAGSIGYTIIQNIILKINYFFVEKFGYNQIKIENFTI